MAAANSRAAHQVLDAQPRVLDDPYAVPMIGSAGLQKILNEPNRFRTPEALAFRAHVLLRSRFAEDRLESAVLSGVKQYVNLGAGFDTFALRQPAWAGKLKILEVDQPATQAMKRAHLSEANLEMPENVAFGSMDFERESVRKDILRHHVSTDEPIFFSWLGVTMYLDEQEIVAVLRSIAEFPKGSEIVLTFVRPGDSLSYGARRAAESGEPWRSAFTPDSIEAQLRAAGFSKIEHLSHEEAQARYFSQRPADLRAPRLTNMLSAML